MPLLSDVEFFSPGYIRGAVFDPQQGERRWIVGLYHNGQLAATCLAELACADWCQIPDLPSDCGFEFNVNLSALQETDLLALAVVNADAVLAEQSLALLKDWRDPTGRAQAGQVRHVQGLTLAGVIDNGVTELPSYEILALDGDRIVGRSRMFRWQHIGDPKLAEGRYVAFDLLVEPDLADGKLHHLRVETTTGMELGGSPVAFLAYPNSYRAALRAVAGSTGSVRADIALDRFLENSMPLTAYGDLYPDLAFSSLLTGAGTLGARGAWRALAGGEWVLVHHSAVTPRDDLAPLLAQVPGADLVYFDLVTRAGGQMHPILFPAFSHERMIEQGYAALCFALPVARFRAAMARAPQSVFAAFLSILQDEGQAEIIHIPHPGGLLDEAALQGASTDLAEALTFASHGEPSLLPYGTQISVTEGTTFPALHVRRPLLDRGVSVIIPTRNQGAMLKACVDSLIAQNPGFELDILVVDNGTTDPETLSILQELEAQGARILEFDGGFNYALINNLAAEHALHEQICFLNNDVEFVMPGVLEELCSRLVDPSVGAVGPLMARASDIVQHGGVVLGPFSGACHAFEDRMRSDPGYAELMQVAQDVSAVTGALLVTRKSLFLGCGGFEEHLFAVNFNDVDYCLRLRSAGRRVIFTPHVWVRHYESVSRGREANSPSGYRMQREVENLRLRWRDVIRNDPFYHPLFSIDTLPYRALSTQHRDPAPRRSTIFPSSELPRWI